MDKIALQIGLPFHRHRSRLSWPPAWQQAQLPRGTMDKWVAGRGGGKRRPPGRESALGLKSQLL